MTLVAEAMRRAFTTVSADATVAEASRLAAREGAEHLLVVEADNLVGMVCCTCDLSDAPADEAVADRMTVPVFTVRPDASLEEAALTMRDCRVGCLPVAAGGLLLGVLTADDVAGVAVAPPRPRACHHHRRS
ncbi:MAG: CBS domain-containing protein [Anaeromyxobacteraceae bacterium]